MACMGQRPAKDLPRRRTRLGSEGRLRCVARGASEVTLEAPALPAEWRLERYDCGGWLSSNAWVPITDLKVSSSEGVTRMQVANLKSETQYAFRVAPDNPELDLQVRCSTASRPSAPKALRVLRRRPQGLTLQVQARPGPLPNLECELQWAQGGILGSWTSKMVLCEEGASVCEILLEQLASCTDYHLRARFRNAVGWSQDFTREAGRTSEIASAPWDLKLLKRRPGQVLLECEVMDPEGAPITELEVQLCGRVSWGEVCSECLASLESWDWDDLGGGPSRRVQVTVSGLPADPVSQLRVWSKNIVGRSLTPSPTLLCRPSSRPEEVRSLRCCRRGLDFMEMDWTTNDPEGAPVLECTLDFWPEHALFTRAQQVEVVRKQQGSFWSATLRGLEPETPYVLRLRCRNVVGVSDLSQLPVFRTADRPVAPASLQSGHVTATTIQLHFELSYDPAQLSCVPGLSALIVEEAGTLVWKTVPEKEVKIDASPNSSGTVHVVVELKGLQGDHGYRFRVWPENAVGRSSVPSVALDCHTSRKPEEPSELRAKSLSAYHMSLSWHVLDPPGAPVWGASVEIATQSMFGAWQPVSDVSLQRDGEHWKQVVYGLEPAQEYVFKVKARNDSGWSEWSEILDWSMPCVPAISDMVLHRIPTSCSADQGSASLMLTFSVHQPEAAPCAVCTAMCYANSQRVLAQREHGNQWTACFPGVDLDPLVNCFRVEAANAVGWATHQDIARLGSPGQRLPEQSSSQVNQFATGFLAKEAAQWDLVCAQGTPERLEEAQLVRGALQVAKLKEKPEVSWWTRCEDFLVTQEDGQLLPKECLAVSLVAFQLLMEGSFAAEQLRNEVEGLWQNLLFLAEALPEEDGLLTWRGRHDDWSGEFQERFAAGWSRACASAVRLLASAAGRGNMMPPLREALSDLQGLLEVHCWLDQQFQDTRSAAEELHQVILGSDVALSIYELHGTAAVTALTQLAGLGGAFHVAVQVYWLEWSFGWCEDGSGIQALHFGSSSLGRFRQRLPLGRTPLAPEEVLSILADMRKNWDGKSYDLLRRNCAHFSIELVRRLRVEEAPEWINALATAGGQIAQWLGVFRPVLMAEEEAEEIADRKLQAPDAQELAEWQWALEYVMERNAEARRVRQKLALRAAASLGRPRRARARGGWAPMRTEETMPVEKVCFLLAQCILYFCVCVSLCDRTSSEPYD
ncbi:unnamed protein product [Effrenium voratum]|nr:unnamed protein product [Effrenium voratum]